MVYGEQCVMMDGTAMMLPQCVDNWDTITVCKSFCIITNNSQMYRERNFYKNSILW